MINLTFDNVDHRTAHTLITFYQFLTDRDAIAYPSTEIDEAIEWLFEHVLDSYEAHCSPKSDGDPANITWKCSLRSAQALVDLANKHR